MGREQAFECVVVEYHVVIEPQQIVGTRRHSSGEGEPHAPSPEQFARAERDLDVGIGLGYCLCGAVTAPVIDQVDVDGDAVDRVAMNTLQARERVLPTIVAGEQDGNRGRFDAK